jgi:MFS family permease
MKAHPLRWYGVVTLFIVAAISYIDRINISVLVTDHSFLDHFELLSGDRVRQGALATLFMIGYGLSSIFITPICSTVLGVRNSLITGLLFWGGVTFITPTAHSYGFLLVSRFLLGVSEGPEDTHRTKRSNIASSTAVPCIL